MWILIDINSSRNKAGEKKLHTNDTACEIMRVHIKAFRLKLHGDSHMHHTLANKL